ncbi:hypothetical protein Tco_1339268 [Tanacetum coccineum]
MDTLFRSVQQKRMGNVVPRILWKNLIGDATEAFRSRVVEGDPTQVNVISTSDVDSMLNILASVIKDAAKDTLSVAIGTSKTHKACRESWWVGEEVFSTWMAFGGNTRDLGSFGEETDEIMDLHQFHEEILFLERGDSVAGIKRRRRDSSSNGVRDFVTALGHGRLNEDLESST